MNHKQDICFSSLSYKAIGAITTLILPSVFQSSFSDGKFICSQLYLFIKCLIFVILVVSFFISSWLNTAVTTYWKHLFFILTRFIYCYLYCLLSNQENVYMIHHNLDLSYDSYNTIAEHNYIQTHYLSLIPNYFDIYFESKSYFINWPASSLIMITMLWLFECIAYSSPLPMEEIKLLAIVNWIFLCVSFFGLILLRYSSNNSALFLLPLLSYLI